MGSVNRVVLVGHLGADPEMKRFEAGRQMARFSLATTERWKDKGTGEPRERTEWHKVVVWDKAAELVEQYLAKGRLVCVEGRLQTRKWQDADGKDRFMTEIVGDEVTFLDARPEVAAKAA